MDRTLHDMRNDLAVAIGTIHAVMDGKLAPGPDRLATVLKALESVDAALVAPPAAKEDLLHAVIEGSPYAKVLVDAHGRIVLVNAQAEELFGYTRDELLGMSIDMLVPERFRHDHPALRAHFSAAPSARPMGAGRDLYGRRKDATEVPIEIGLNPIVNGGESFTLAAITDITERRNAEAMRLAHAGMQQHAAELEELNRELANVSRFKTEFVATMSHELRTPLSAIVASAELLQSSELDERGQVAARMIVEASEALLALINTVLDFSKIEAGKMELAAGTFEIGPVLEGAARVLAQMAREKHIALDTYVDPSIPPLVGDRDRVRQIVLNLLGNAVKFTERGHVAVRAVCERLTAAEAVVRVEVRDTGIGIPFELLPQLFEPFVQADRSASRKFAGTGLGLSISKRLAEMMGGTIGVDSVAGSGSSFWFAVPFARADADPDARRLSPVPTRTAPRAPLPAAGAVLVAEDNRQLQELLQLQFDDLGVPVSVVSNGRAAVEAVRNGDYAMVFMDCQMPHLDGFDATKAIRERERHTGGHIPIAAMTANAFAEDRAACLAAGMDDHLAKPVKLADLRAMIERWTNRAV